MKLTAITGCGSYYSPWTKYLLASLYHVVDEIVVVNGGFNLKDPHVNEYNIPLEQVSRDISELDFKGKIVEVKDFTIDDLRHKFDIKTQVEGRNQTGWYDIRGLNLTLASEKAIERGADWIMKTDSDQCLYEDCRRLKLVNVPVILHQYEFQGDIYHLANPGPNSPFNDSIFTYLSHPDDYYGGGGAPSIHSNRIPTDRYHCAHLRSANPTDATEEEKFIHFRDRNIFHHYTNEYSDFTSALYASAHRTAKDMLMKEGVLSSVPAPKVCYIRRNQLAEWVKELT